ncbi:MAG: SBBP repeat-containing protein [Nitrososphaerota archaeon]
MRWSSFLATLALLASIFSIAGLSASNAQTIGWAKYLDGINQNDIGYRVAIYSDYIIVVGSYNNGTHLKIFVANLSKADGTIKWVQGLKIHDNDEAYDVAVDSEGNIYVVGQAQDIGVGYYEFVAKFKPDKTLVWSKIWDAINIKNVGVAVDSGENVYVAGAIPEGSYTDCLIMKLKSDDGSVIWSKKIGISNNYEYAIDTAVDSNNNIYVMGYNGTAGVFLLKLSDDGTMIWGKTWQIISTTNGRALTVDTSGNIYVAGDFLSPASYRDVFIAKFDQSGNPIWAKGWNFRSDFAFSMAADSQQVYLAGYVFDPSTNDHAALIIALDPDGVLKWDILFNGTGFDEANGLASGSLYITGGTTSPSLALEDISGNIRDVTIFPFMTIFGGPTDITLTLTDLGVEYTNVLPGETTDRYWWDIFILRLDGPAPPVGGEIMSPQLSEAWRSSTPLIAATSAVLLITAGIIIISSAKRNRRD